MTCAHGVSPISLPSIDAARNLGPIGSVYTFPHFSRDIVLGLSSKNNCTSYDWSKWKPLFKIASVSPHDQCCDSQESLETWWKCNSVQNMPPPIPFCCEEFTALSQLCLTIPTQRQQFVKEIKRIVCKEMQDFEEEESLSKLFTLAVMFLRLLSLRRHSFCGQFYAADAGLSVVLELVVLHDYIKTSQAQWGYLMDGHLFQKLSMTVRRCFLSSSQPNSFAQACDALCCTLSLHIIMRRVGTDFPVLAKKGWMTDKIRNLMQ